MYDMNLHENVYIERHRYTYTRETDGYEYEETYYLQSEVTEFLKKNIYSL